MVLACLGLLAASCEANADDGSARPPDGGRPPRSSTPTTLAAPLPPPPPAATPTFDGAVAAITDADRNRMLQSWRPGCPVPLEELRVLTLDHWGYDGIEHRGELVVHVDHAQDLVEVFRRLFEMRFPIERMQLVDVYGGDDHRSTLDNNTAAFNCREVVGRPGAWSEHAFGRAIDVNPRVNPYVLDPRIHHPALAPYLDRSLDDPGIIRAGDAVVATFATAGWQWGGAWSAPDYQHFSATGR